MGMNSEQIVYRLGSSTTLGIPLGKEPRLYVGTRQSLYHGNVHKAEHDWELGVLERIVSTHLEQASSPKITGRVYLAPSQSGLRSDMLRAKNRPSFRQNGGTTRMARLPWNSLSDAAGASNESDCTRAAN